MFKRAACTFFTLNVLHLAVLDHLQMLSSAA